MAAANRKEVVEIVEEVDAQAAPTGPGIEVGLIIFTTVALVVAMIVGFQELGSHYAAGPMGP